MLKITLTALWLDPVVQISDSMQALSVASKKSAENHGSGNDGNEDPDRTTSGG
jgi:hypothetical protein